MHAPADAEITFQFDEGIAYADHTCRRGELICWPTWEPAPLAPMDAKNARRVMAMMGAQLSSPRRQFS